MKRYLFFQTPDSGFDLATPQFTLCGNPRVVVLNPVSNALTFLWEQIDPDPLIAAVSFVPNNTSKNVTVTIPNNISTDITIKVTLNGDVNNFRIIKVNLNLVDTVKSFSTGKGLSNFNNTLNNPLPFLLAPYPLLGPQAIYYTDNNQTTGVRFLGQFYRQTYINKIDVFTDNNTFIQEVDVFKTVNESLTSKDDRLNLKVNTPYNILKKWLDIKVLSQEIIPISQKINLTFPNIIADDYIASFNSGSGFVVQQRTPFSVQNQFANDSLINNFNTGTGLLIQQRTPFTVQSISVIDNITNNFNTGTGLAIQLRTPYTSNIVG